MLSQLVRYAEAIPSCRQAGRPQSAIATTNLTIERTLRFSNLQQARVVG